jgi:hypothetical protein
MLPDIRAVLAAIVAAVGLLVAAFGVVATLRVAQQQHAGSFQADLAARGRPVQPASATPSATAGERMVLIIDTPGPHLAPVARSAAPVIPVAQALVQEPARAPAQEPAPDAPPAPIIAVQTLPLPPPVLTVATLVDAPQAAPHAQAPQPRPPAEAAQATPPIEAAQVAPPSDPPIGGPLVAEPPRRQAETSRSGAGDDAAANRKRAAAEQARKARAARIAKERKAAAKRAAQARRAKQPSSPSFGNSNRFGTINQVGGTFSQ